jgi:cytochrome c oxidase cbb3-type subunit 3
MGAMTDKARRTDPIQGAIVHEYDGIEEADNQLPRWWVFCFIATIAFGLAYWLGFEVLQGRLSPYEEYVVARAAAEELRANELAALPTVSEQMLAQLAAQSSSVAEGRAVFSQQCVPCHGENAEGKIGPNLTDGHWLNGSGPIAIHATISNGVLAKGMPAWSAVLGPKATLSVTAYVLSVRNTMVTGKPPEGTVESPKRTAL